MEVTFTVDEREYRINSITVGDWYKVKEYMLVDGHDAAFKAVSELSGCPVEMLKQLKTHQWLKLWNAVESYALSANEAKLEKQMKIGDTLYGLVSMDQLTIGEFADMDVLMNDPLKESKLHQMMAILYRPVTEAKGRYYDVEAYDPIACSRRADDFLKAPLSACLGLINFFLDFAKTSYAVIADSLREQVSKATGTDPKLRSSLEELISSLPEVGTTAFSDFQEATLSNLTKLRNSASTQR